MYNLRYHVASLVAVFLALAVGLLLGTVVAERGMLTDQSDALIGDLQKRFDQLNATNDELSVGLERDRGFITDVEGLLTVGDLQGADVVLVVGRDSGDEVAAARKAVEAAGASVSVLTMRTPDAGLMTAEPEGLAGLLYGSGTEIAPAGEGLVEQIAAIAATELAVAGPKPTLDLLAERDVIELRSASETATADAVVVLAADEGPDAFGIALAAAMLDQGRRAAGAETGVESDSEELGIAVACDEAGIPAVDHLDTPQGRISLVWILAGRASGYYGTSERADAYYPAVPAGD